MITLRAKEQESKRASQEKCSFKKLQSACLSALRNANYQNFMKLGREWRLPALAGLAGLNKSLFWSAIKSRNVLDGRTQAAR